MGGCGCKIAPDILASLLQNHSAYSRANTLTDARGLVVGNDKFDDAAVYELTSEQALIATVDFFTPIVDDPKDFGRIAAANALSDVYAMGGTPLFALNIMGFPVKNQTQTDTFDALGGILAGGAEICQQAGILIAGGHSIDTVNPIYGLAVIGIAHPKQIKRNDGANDGDNLILGKPLGIGILAAAIQKGKADSKAYQELINWATRLNQVGSKLAIIEGVNGMTDITGFGLLGHLSEMSKASSLKAMIDMDDVPLIKTACKLVQEGISTGAMKQNARACHDRVHFAQSIEDWQKNILFDPQTNGGLLVSCRPDQTQQVIDLFVQEGFSEACKIGRMVQGTGHDAEPLIRVC